jgi:hypothetical protein
MSDCYPLELMQAISDWQRGGSAAQKKKRGARLKELVATLPAIFRRTTNICYRQVALEGRHLRKAGTEFELVETISSWTKSEEIAKSFKGGVPPKGGYQGVIFSIFPADGSVIVDLAHLFTDVAFRAAIEHYKLQIKGFHDGIGRYGNTQQEVVIELERVPLSAFRCWGGYSSSQDDLARMFFHGRSPTAAQREWFEQLLAKSKTHPGPNWVCSSEAVERVNEALKFHAVRVSKRATGS